MFLSKDDHRFSLFKRTLQAEDVVILDAALISPAELHAVFTVTLQFSVHVISVRCSPELSGGVTSAVNIHPTAKYRYI